MATAGARVKSADITTVENYTSGRGLTRLVQQAAQTGNASAASLVLTFGTGSTDFDLGNWHDEATNNTRVTPTVAGYYRIIVKPVIAFNGAITGINTFVRKNGAVIERTGNHRPNTTGINAGGIMLETWATANGSTDYFEGGVTCTTSSGTWDTNGVAGSLSVLQVEFMRPL